MSDSDDKLPPDPNDIPASVADAGSETESLDQQLSSAIKKPAKNAERNKKLIRYGMIGGALLLVAFFVYSCQPAKGGMAFGICSTYVEMNTPYPHTLNYTGLEGSRTAIRIYFTHIDPFGEYKQEFIECSFGADEAGGMKILQISRNRRKVDQKAVDDFNKTLPAIIEGEPYTVLPPNWENQLVPR